jgi:hypothetical protein
MKTLTLLLLAALSFPGCATDADYVDGGGLRPGYKPSLDPETPTTHPAIDESFQLPEDNDPLVDDGRVVWAEVIASENSRLVRLHHFDSETGIDQIDTLDEDGIVQRTIVSRLHPTEIPVDGHN